LDCREERKKIQVRQYRERKKQGNVLKLGETMQCEICLKEIIRNSARQRFCAECAAMHLKEIDNRQSLEWKHEHPEKIKESKRKLSKRRHEKGEQRESGIKYITWDKGTNKWRVLLYLNRKQVDCGRFKNIEDAIKAKKEAEEKYFKPFVDEHKA